jgi:hypothetical protein
MANDNQKSKNPSQSKPDQGDGMRDPQRKQQQGGNQQVSRDQDQKDRNKMGEQEGMEREQQSSGGQSPDPSKGELGTEIDDEEDDLGGEDVEDEDRITQRSPAQRGDSDKSAK